VWHRTDEVAGCDRVFDLAPVEPSPPLDHERSEHRDVGWGPPNPVTPIFVDSPIVAGANVDSAAGVAHEPL